MVEITRRNLFKAAGATGLAAAVAGAGIYGSRAWASPTLASKPGATDASVADQVRRSRRTCRCAKY